MYYGFIIATDLKDFYNFLLKDFVGLLGSPLIADLADTIFTALPGSIICNHDSVYSLYYHDNHWSHSFTASCIVSPLVGLGFVLFFMILMVIRVRYMMYTIVYYALILHYHCHTIYSVSMVIFLSLIHI